MEEGLASAGWERIEEGPAGKEGWGAGPPSGRPRGSVARRCCQSSGLRPALPLLPAGWSQHWGNNDQLCVACSGARAAGGCHPGGRLRGMSRRRVRRKSGGSRWAVSLLQGRWEVRNLCEAGWGAIPTMATRGRSGPFERRDYFLRKGTGFKCLWNSKVCRAQGGLICESHRGLNFSTVPFCFPVPDGPLLLRWSLPGAPSVLFPRHRFSGSSLVTPSAHLPRPPQRTAGSAFNLETGLLVTLHIGVGVSIKYETPG